MGGEEAGRRHRVHRVALAAGSVIAKAMAGARATARATATAAAGPPEAAGEADKVEVSCYHHQCVDRLGDGLAVTGRAADGTVAALELPGRRAWFTAVQWHPEDTAASDAGQQALFGALVEASRGRVS